MTDVNDPIYEPYGFDEPLSSKRPRQPQLQLLTQIEADYMVAKMILSQRNAEFLASFLKQRKVTRNVNSTQYRRRQTAFQCFFTEDEKKRSRIIQI